MGKLYPTNFNMLPEFISSFDWGYFFTFTTRYQLTHKSAHRLTRRTYEKWLGLSQGNQRMFFAIEDFKNKGGCHVHGLYYAENYLQTFWNEAILSYQKMTGEKNAITSFVENEGFVYGESIDNTRSRIKLDLIKGDPIAVSKYCAKYILKNGVEKNLNWDFLNGNSYI